MTHIAGCWLGFWMMKRVFVFKSALWLFLAMLLVSVPVLAQTRNRQALEQEKRQNLERMIQIRNVLRQTAREKRVTLGQLRALNQQIQAQTRQINLLTEDMRLTEVEVTELRTASDKLTQDLEKLKTEYGTMITNADRRRQQLNPLGFLVAADNFNQLVARFRYLKQYSNARQGQVRQMEQVKTMLQGKRQATVKKRDQQQVIIKTKVNEGRKLAVLKTEQDRTAKQLSKKESDLRTELAESRRAIQQLESMITRVIAREARERADRERAERAEREKEREKLARAELAKKAIADKKHADEVAAAKEAGKPAPPPPEPEPEAKKPEPARTEPSRMNNLNDAEEALASSFAASRSRLSWPVTTGFISDRFGVHEHPVLKGIKVDNQGVDIQTNAGQSVRAVYDGIVRDVASMPGMNSVVLVQHGDYYTVYAKLRNVSVKNGQRIKARETIGTVATNKDGVSEVQFQIWKETSRLNPENWLVPR
jgi:murein hydrolase activator